MTPSSTQLKIVMLEIERYGNMCVMEYLDKMENKRLKLNQKKSQIKVTRTEILKYGTMCKIETLKKESKKP